MITIHSIRRTMPSVPSPSRDKSGRFISDREMFRRAARVLRDEIMEKKAAEAARGLSARVLGEMVDG